MVELLARREVVPSGTRIRVMAKIYFGLADEMSPPHPGPLPLGEGESHAAFVESNPLVVRRDTVLPPSGTGLG